MQEFATSFHSAATLIFVFGSAVVSVRLLALARRTREAPELLLGSAILCTAVLGYGVLIGGLVVRGGDLRPEAASTLAVLLSGSGKLVHAAGVTLFVAFVLRVFRPQERWAHVLAGGLLASLWIGALGTGWTTGFRVDPVGQASWWAEYLVIWTYPLWMGAESFAWWSRMRRRVRLGLADPLVANRFLLWGIGSVFTALAIWSASLPFALASDLARVEAVTPAVRIVTAIAGVASVSCSYFAFLPPAWYQRKVRAAAASEEAPALA